MSPKVAVLTNIYAPYKEPLFASLARKVRLRVFYCQRTEANRKWNVEFTGNYDYDVLPGRSPSLGGRYFHINPSIGRAIRTGGFDAVIIGGYSFPTAWLAMVAARRAKLPMILWSGGVRQPGNWGRALTWPLKRFCIRLFDGYIAYTQRARQYLVLLGALPEAITVAPITVDVDFFATRSAQVRRSGGRERLRADLGLGADHVAVVFVGQLLRGKAGDVLLRTLVHLSQEAHLLMVGDGAMRDAWKRLAERLGVAGRVSWLGHVPQDRLAELYAASDVFVLPSRREQSGNVINEAMASGLPAVITQEVGTDVVRDGVEGFIVPADDVEGLAAKLNCLITNPSLRGQMGRLSRQRMQEDFTIEHEAGQFVEAIRLSLERRRGEAERGRP